MESAEEKVILAAAEQSALASCRHHRSPRGHVARPRSIAKVAIGKQSYYAITCAVFIEDMLAHGVGRGVVKRRRKIVEADYLMEPGGQLMEQNAQIVVRRNGLRNRQQGAVPVAAGRRIGEAVGA